jgi:hypothetical protein
MGAEERGPEDFAGVDLERGAGTVPEAIEIVDLYHARQHLWDFGSKLYPCENAAKRRRAMSDQYWLDTGKIELLVDRLRAPGHRHTGAGGRYRDRGQ